MQPSTSKLTIQLNAAPDDEPEGIEERSRALVKEIKLLDVERVDTLETGEAPAGAKGDPVTIGAIVVALVAANGVLPTLITAVANAIKGRSERTATLELGGDKLVVTNVTQAEQQQLIRAWLNRASRQ